MAKKKQTTQPTLTSQIKELVDRKHAINENRQAANKGLQDFQKKYDDASSALSELIAENMAFPSEKNTIQVSDARAEKNAILLAFENAKADLADIPNSIKKLDLRIAELTGKKKLLEGDVIADKLSDIDDLKAKAREAIADLSAALCLTTTRNTNYVGVREVCKQLDKDNSVSILFINKYTELESKMGFDAL